MLGPEVTDIAPGCVCVAKIDDAVSLLALGLFRREYDTALLQINVPCLNNAELLRP